MSRKVLGLEIREEAIAAVLLESGFKGSTLVDQLYAPIPADNAGDVGLGKALDFLMERLKPAGATCVLGIPTSFVSFRNLSVPFHDLKKIRQVLPFELEPSLPMPVEELIFDFEAVKRDGHQDLLAFVAEKSQLDRYLKLLETVSLRPVLITPSGYAAARMMANIVGPEDDLLFIDTAKAHHTIYAVNAGHVRMVRTLPVGAGGYPVIRSMEMAIKRTFTVLEENMDIAVNPSTVFSMGSQSHLLDAGNGTSKLLGVPIKSIEAIRTFPRLTGKTDTPEWASGHLDMALALALMEAEAVSGVNFSTQRTTIQHYWGEFRQSIIVSAVLILLVITTALTGQFISVGAKNRRLAELDRQIETVFKSTFPEVTRVVDPLQQMQIKIKEAGEGGTGLEFTTPQVRVIDILNALSQKIPSSVDVMVSRMVVGTDNVMLSGDTLNFNTVDDIKGRLESAEIFKSVTISSADLEKSGKRVRFKLKLDF
jgi:general secretion pathway protein L